MSEVPLIHRHQLFYIIFAVVAFGGFLICYVLEHRIVCRPGRIDPDNFGSWGYIDKNGVMVISPRFNSAREFHNGFASVDLDPRRRKYVSSRRFEAVIDTQGKLISQKLCSTHGSMNDGFIPVSDPVLDLDEYKRNTETDDDSASLVSYSNPAGYLRSDGQFTFLFEKCGNFENGIAVVQDSDKAFYDPLFKIVDADFKEVATLPGSAQELSISEGLIPVSTKVAEPTNDKGSKFLVGFADIKGRLVIPFKFAEAAHFSCGRAVVKLPGSDTCCLIDRSGRCIATTKYDRILDFQDGVACAISGGDTDVIDLNGTVLSTFPSEQLDSFSEGLARVWERGGTSFFDKKGKEAFHLDNVRSNSFHEGLCGAGIEKDGKRLYGFINKKGEWAIQPQFGMVGDFSEGLAAVRIEHSALQDLQTQLSNLFGVH